MVGQKGAKKLPPVPAANFLMLARYAAYMSRIKGLSSADIISDSLIEKQIKST